MSRNKEKSPARVAFIIFGELSREELSRVHPLLASLQDVFLDVQVVFVSLENRQRTLDFHSWAMWGRKEGWKAIIFLPFVRVADLPWIGSGTLEDFPIYFLKNPGVQDLQALSGALLEFLNPLGAAQEIDSPRPLRFDVLRHAADPHPENDVWISLQGELGLLDKIPFLIQYLKNAPPQEVGLHGAETSAEILITQLRNDVFEKDVTIKRLLRSEKRYKKFFEDDITGDFVMDLDWRVVDCNRSFARIFGFPSIDYALGFDVRAMFPDHRARRELVGKFFQLNYLDYCEMELLRPDGQMVHIIANLLGIKNDEGRLTQIRGFLFDNTPRKNLEKQLRESQRMEGLGRLAGGIAHDFNNLLTVINGYTELLISEMPPGAPALVELGEVLQAGLRAAELTSQLLSFSRRQVLTPKILNLNEVVGNLETMLGRLMNERITLKLDLDPSLLPIQADKGQLDQVIMNLVLNGRDAMAQGGTLTIKTENLTVDTSVYDSSDLLLPGSYVCMRVIDTGVGMDEETLKRIFEPFFTTKEQGKGTGLGLAMVYGSVQQSGGYLKVDSSVGKGTTFTILFNAWTEKREDPERPSREERLVPTFGRQEKILLVEDEEMVRDYAIRILTRYGYKVKGFADGREALEFLGSTAEKWDLVITDVVMPFITGPELILGLHKLGKRMRVLYMSGYTDDEILRHGVSTQKVQFFHKPFSSKEILAKIREILDEPLEE